MIELFRFAKGNGNKATNKENGTDANSNWAASIRVLTASAFLRAWA